MYEVDQPAAAAEVSVGDTLKSLSGEISEYRLAFVQKRYYDLTLLISSRKASHGAL